MADPMTTPRPFRIGAIVRASAVRLARVVYPYGAVRRVLCGPARDARFVVSPAMGVNYALGTKAAICGELMALVRPGMTVFDVGANEGQMALAFDRQLRGRGAVIAIEPAPAPFSALERNLQLSAARNVRARQLALSDAAGVLTLMYDERAPTQNKLVTVEPTHRVGAKAVAVDVQADTLDAVSQSDGPPDVIKIDVEGAAAVVLRGARHTLHARSPVIYIELHGPEEQAGVRDSLVAAGYTARTLDGRVVADPTAAWASPLICRKE